MINSYFPERYNDFFDMYEKKIIKCWTNIKKNWTEKDFENSIEKWDRVQKNITSKKSRKFTSNVCKTCNIEWNDRSWIHKEYIELKNTFWVTRSIHVLDVCPNCDCYINPFLSNPINRECVDKYISKDYHIYIIPLQRFSYVTGFNDGMSGATLDSYSIDNRFVHFKDKIHMTDSMDTYTYSKGFKDGIETSYNYTFKTRKPFMEELKCSSIYYFGSRLDEEETEDDEWLMVV